MALIAGPLGHLTLPGITLALLYEFDVSLGAFLFVVLGIFLIWLIELRTKLPMEALTAIIFASGVATSFVFLPEDKTVPALIGDVSQITTVTVVIAIIVSIITFRVTNKIFSEIILVGISEDLARVQGVDSRRLNLVYLGCIALVVSLGVRLVGGLMTAAIIAIPACTSRNLAKNLRQYSYGGMVFGSLGCSIGIASTEFIEISAGLLIILVNTLFFLVSLFLVRNVNSNR